MGCNSNCGDKKTENGGKCYSKEACNSINLPGKKEGEKCGFAVWTRPNDDPRRINHGKCDKGLTCVEGICKKTDVCKEAKGVIGSCRALIPSWTYDKYSGKCEEFSYGGW